MSKKYHTQRDERESLQRRAVQSYRAGNEMRWVTCMIASRFVGRYKRGYTIGLATDLALSVDAVENMARAGVIYKALRPHASDLPEIRRKLTYTHFAEIGKAAKQYDLSIPEILDQLREAADKGMSVEIMLGTLGRGEDGNKVPHWSELLKKSRSSVQYVMEVGGTPTELWNICDKFIAHTEGFLE